MQANPHQMVKDGRMQPVPVIPDYSGANLTGIIPGCLLGTSGRRPNWFPQPLQEAERVVLLVIDGNTGQNALAQVKAFDETLGLTGLIVTKLDGTAKGGVLAAIALWVTERQKKHPEWRTVPVYFIGVGEKLEDLETFNAREFAQALLS
mgnify:CR=1 FL=1